MTERRDLGTVMLVRGLAELMEKYRMPVDQALLQLPVDYRMATVEDVAWARELSLALYDGSASGIGLPDDSRAGGVEDLPAEFAVDLRELLLKRCPDRAVRLTVLLNPPQASDVKKLAELKTGVGMTAKRILRKNFAKSMLTFSGILCIAGRSAGGDPLNVSGWMCLNKLQGSGQANVMHYSRRVTSPRGGA